MGADHLMAVVCDGGTAFPNSGEPLTTLGSPESGLQQFMHFQGGQIENWQSVEVEVRFRRDVNR